MKENLADGLPLTKGENILSVLFEKIIPRNGFQLG